MAGVPTTIGVALIGDFRQRPPTEAQRLAAVRLCADLAQELMLKPEAIVGHDELKEGSSDPDKECPGRYLPLPELRDEVRRIIDEPRLYSFVW